MSACRSARVTPGASTSTRLEAPPEIRNSGCACGGSVLDPGEQPRTGGERALIRQADVRRSAISHARGARRGARRCCASRVMMSVCADGAARVPRGRRRHGEAPPCRRRPPTPGVPASGGSPAQGGAHAAAAIHRAQARPAAARAAARGAGRTRRQAQLPRTILSLAGARGAPAFAASERSSCSRSRYSGVMSPVTYSPEKHEVSNSSMRASSCLQAAIRSSRSW